MSGSKYNEVRSYSEYPTTHFVTDTGQNFETQDSMTG
jgi:hypothetical protein